MSGDETVDNNASALASPLDENTNETRLALVLLWSFEEPERAGETLFLTPQKDVLLGRGQKDASWMRCRPGRLVRMPPLKSRSISREQLRLHATEHAVHVTNTGRCELRFKGQPVPVCTLSPGMTMELHNQLLFLCVRRPMSMTGAAEKAHSFGHPDSDGLVGEGAEMWALRERIALMARHEKHVLLLGDSGTGKELVARAIHTRSPRASRALVARNVTTIPESLFDAELFGNAINYPNAGMPERPGLVGEAHGSTLFLDEIGDLPMALQTHLLRLLDSQGEYHRLGESRMRTSDLRLIGATNRPLEELRKDFLARFALRLKLPTLNERREDIPLLVRHLMERAASQDASLGSRFFEPNDHSDLGALKMTPSLVEALVTHNYSYNVRELDTLLWSAITSSPDGWLRLRPAVRETLGLARLEAPQHGAVVAEDGKEALPGPDEVRAAMESCGGVQAKAWRVLGLRNRYQLGRLIKKYGIEVTSKEDDD